MQTQQELEAAATVLKQLYGHDTSLSNITQQQKEQEQPLQIQQSQEQETGKTNLTGLQAQTAILKLKRQSQFRSNVCQRAIFLLFLMNFVVPTRFNITGMDSLDTVLKVVLGLIGILALGAWRLHYQAKQSILQINDIQMIGPLAEAFDAETLTRPTAVIMALRRLLPRLQATDAAVLTRYQRFCLYHALKRENLRGGFLRYDRDLALDILKAMEQIGDQEALPYVQKVANSSWDKELCDAANNCLSFLHQQTEDYKRGETLLRPSSAISTSPDILLRPASGVPTTPSDELLRAGDEIGQ